VFEVASSDLVNMGISVVSYTLKDLKDDEVTTWWHCTTIDCYYVCFWKLIS